MTIPFAELLSGKIVMVEALSDVESRSLLAAAGDLIFVLDRPPLLPLSLVEWTTSRFPKAR